MLKKEGFISEIMEKTTSQKYFRANMSIYAILLFSIFVVSCNGQEKTKSGESSDTELFAISYDKPVIVNQPVSQEFIDPLFFIKGQLCQHLRRIFQDKRGDLWFGSNVYGIMRYNGDKLEYFSENDGIGGGRITGIVEDKEGNVWFGTYGGLTRYDGKSFTNFSEKDGLVNNDVWSLIIDSNGIFWIGTMEGISRFDGKEFTTFPIPKPDMNNTTSILSRNRISNIMQDRNGTFWFGTDGYGICRYDPSVSPGSGKKTFTFFTKKDGLCGDNVTHILEDKNGDIWISTMFGGISRYDGKSFTNFTLNGVVSGIEVWSIYEDKAGNIWFPAENFGVYRYNGKSFANFTEKDGLNTNAIQCIFEDKEGRVWLGGWGGLFRYDRSAEQANGKSFSSVTINGPWAK